MLALKVIEVPCTTVGVLLVLPGVMLFVMLTEAGWQSKPAVRIGHQSQITARSDPLQNCGPHISRLI